MLALFGLIKVEVLESELPYLKVKPQRKLSRASQNVTAKVGERTFRLKVKPVERDTDATWVEILDAFKAETQLARALDDLEERRANHRQRTTLDVRSPDLPNFRATTVDISETGLRLATDGPVEIGAHLRLEVDSCNPCRSAQDISAVTIWTLRRSDTDYQVGVRVLKKNTLASTYKVFQDSKR